MRRVVVLPAPSGPMRPNISPRRTSKLTSEAARTEPKRRVRACALTRSSLPAPGAGGASRPRAGRHEARLGRHAGLEEAVRVLEADLER